MLGHIDQLYLLALGHVFALLRLSRLGLGRHLLFVLFGRSFAFGLLLNVAFLRLLFLLSFLLRSLLFLLVLWLLLVPLLLFRLLFCLMPLSALLSLLSIIGLLCLLFLAVLFGLLRLVGDVELGAEIIFQILESKCLRQFGHD